MPQTENTLRALQLDIHLCLWCLIMEDRITRTQTGHHIIGRTRSDRVKDIISLCQKHHDMAHRHKITKQQLYGLISGREPRITGA